MLLVILTIFSKTKHFSRSQIATYITIHQSSGSGVYPHMPILYVNTPHDHVFGSQRVIVVNVVEVVALWPIRPILGFWGAKFTKWEIRYALDSDEPHCKI